MNCPTKSRTKAIVYSCCYASEGSALCAGAAVGRSDGDNPVRDGFEQGGLCAVWWKGLLVARPIVHNVTGVYFRAIRTDKL